MGKELRKVRAFEAVVSDINGSEPPVIVVDDSGDKARNQISADRAVVDSRSLGWSTVELYGSEPDFLVKTPDGREVVISDEHPSYNYMARTFDPLLRQIDEVRRKETED
ncbi:hypothetical protein [Stenotrophomonas pictorum]|uniref:hypothetical protein n=1 Tax=Stenotrophomonas pictorum TaxID=86184 RepID=UPI0011AE26C7|nr:hypothetical protein [Stenotrophomonas pictorum]